METKNIVKSLTALAQESRLKIFKLLVQAGSTGLAAGKISELTAITPSSLSFHLKELLHADMVNLQPDGRFMIYTANYQTMNNVLQYLTENCCNGVSCTAERPPCSTS